MNSTKKTVLSAAALAATAGLIAACGSSGDTVSGEGATSQQKAMQHFSDVLADNGDIVLDYTGSGSGDGIKKFINGDVDFAGSDTALSAEEATDAAARCDNNPAWHLPLVIGPVAMAYNLPGVDELNLTPELLAEIFDSRITKWNDPAIAAVNPGASLPDTDIVPVHRSDSSGTTENFQAFLKTSVPDAWPYEVGKDFRGQGGSAASKSTGVGDTVSRTEGAITYVEWGFATENDLGVAAVDFGSGATPLTPETAGTALDSVTFVEPGSKDLVVNRDALFALNEPGAYPLIMTTYEIVCSTGYSSETVSSTLKSAFTTILDDGQEGLADIGFVPLPQEFAETIRGTVDALSDDAS